MGEKQGAAGQTSDKECGLTVEKGGKVRERCTHTRNNTPLPRIQEEEDVTEATPIGEVQDHDGITNERQEEGEDPIPHYVKDVQEMLRARSTVQPVGPVRINVVRRPNKAGEGGRRRTNEGESGGIGVGQQDITEGDRKTPFRTSTTNPQQHSSTNHSRERGSDKSHATSTSLRSQRRCRRAAR